MKKMIVIAALIGTMLMPAQMMAGNKNNNKRPRVEMRGNKRDNRRDIKIGKDYRMGKPGKPARRPAPVVVVNRPAPRPCPPPPPPPVHRCHNEAAEIVSTVVGLAALVSLIAN